MNTDFDDNEIDSVEELCPSVSMFVSLLTMDKPFGIIWSREHQIYFLKKLGYKIIESNKDNTDYPPIQVAVKADSDMIPDINNSNIEEVFSDEVQKILLNWLLKIKAN